MKNIIVLLFLTLSGTIFSQTNNSNGPRYGNDSVTCITNLSTMVEFSRIKVYDYALPSWREVFNICPGASKNIYIYGVSIFKSRIEKEQYRRFVCDVL